MASLGEQLLLGFEIDNPLLSLVEASEWQHSEFRIWAMSRARSGSLQQWIHWLHLSSPELSAAEALRELEILYSANQNFRNSRVSLQDLNHGSDKLQKILKLDNDNSHPDHHSLARQLGSTIHKAMEYMAREGINSRQRRELTRFWKALRPLASPEEWKPQSKAVSYQLCNYLLHNGIIPSFPKIDDSDMFSCYLATVALTTIAKSIIDFPLSFRKTLLPEISMSVEELNGGRVDCLVKWQSRHLEIIEWKAVIGDAPYGQIAISPHRVAKKPYAAHKKQVIRYAFMIAMKHILKSNSNSLAEALAKIDIRGKIYYLFPDGYKEHLVGIRAIDLADMARNYETRLTRAALNQAAKKVDRVLFDCLSNNTINTTLSLPKLDHPRVPISSNLQRALSIIQNYRVYLDNTRVIELRSQRQIAHLDKLLHEMENGNVYVSRAPDLSRGFFVRCLHPEG